MIFDKEGVSSNTKESQRMLNSLPLELQLLNDDMHYAAGEITSSVGSDKFSPDSWASMDGGRGKTRRFPLKMKGLDVEKLDHPMLSNKASGHFN